VNRLRVGVVGASGYVGGELLRLLLQHPNVEVTLATSRHCYSPDSDLRIYYRPTELKCYAWFESRSRVAFDTNSQRLRRIAGSHPRLFLERIPDFSSVKTSFACEVAIITTSS